MTKLFWSFLFYLVVLSSIFMAFFYASNWIAENKICGEVYPEQSLVGEWR